MTDLISRQALIEEFADMREGYPIMTDEQLTAEDVIKIILSMPTAEPKTDMLDKIRADIMSKDGLEEALEIIDKYRAESEEV